MYSDFAINPSPDHASATINGTEYNNQALQASSRGDFATAERLHLQAIKVKEAGLGTDAVSTALSYNAIGELYLEMKKLDKAEEYLSKSAAIRNIKGPPFDGAVTRENLAQLEELKGNLPKAKEIRLSGAPDHLACGYYQVMYFSPAWRTMLNHSHALQCAGQMFKLSDLKHCGRCKVSLQVPELSPSPKIYPQAVYYCSVACQVSFPFY